MAAAPWVPCTASRIYNSVPNAHHKTVFWWRDLSLLEVEIPPAPLVRDARAGTGLTNVGTEEGQGFGTLGTCQYGIDQFDLWAAYVPATIEGALAQVCWTWQSWLAVSHSTWFRVRR